MRYIVLLLVVVLLGCSKEQECECNREVYERVISKAFDADGNIIMHTKHFLLRTEPVLCQDEVNDFTEFGDLFFKISCN